MITHPVHEQLKTLTSSVNDLINILNQSKNVSSDAKNILLNYNIDISNSWKSNDIYINKLSSGLTKVVNNNNIELFTITNESAKLTHFNSGKIKYEDLNSQTILLLDRLHFKTVTIQENDGKKILLDSIETDKLLNSLQVSKTLDSMLSNVNNVSEKFSKLESKNKKQKSAAFLDSELSVESILDKTKQTKVLLNYGFSDEQITDIYKNLDNDLMARKIFNLVVKTKDITIAPLIEQLDGYLHPSQTPLISFVEQQEDLLLNTNKFKL